MDVRAHLEALIAQHAAFGQSLALLREALPAPVPRVSFSCPERCDGINACALKDDDARQARGSFGDPHAWRCVGCGHQESTPRAM
jgi:hypothetical protein